tara:strand:+ start:362 stop:1018 length:657 start_codon:yes stop_codon:yes gene_type:complete
MTTVYWLNDPKILFDKNYITELWPSNTMTYTEKMNTLCRLIILLTIIGLLLFRKLSILIIGLIILCILTYMYNKELLKKGVEIDNNETQVKKDKKEGFTNMLPWKSTELNLKDAVKVNNKNPLNNHLVTDSIGAENKIKRKTKMIKSSKLTDIVRDNSETKNDIEIQDNLVNNFIFDRNLRQFYNVPDYDKDTITYLSGNPSMVRDKIFVKQDERFIQ